MLTKHNDSRNTALVLDQRGVFVFLLFEPETLGDLRTLQTPRWAGGEVEAGHPSGNGSSHELLALTSQARLGPMKTHVRKWEDLLEDLPIFEADSA